MAHLRFKSRFCPAPPPPSPLIASRSTSGVVEESDPFPNIPENPFIDENFLRLPEEIQCLFMAGIDYNLLLSRDKYSIGCLLRSASDFGMFRISNHGILAEDLESTLADSESVFGSSSVFINRVDHRQEFVWRPSMQALSLTRKYRRLSERMEIVASKLEIIAEELGQIFSVNAKKQQYSHKIEASEPILSLSRHNRPLPGVKSSAHNHETQQQHCKHALILHIPVDEAEFSYQTEQSPSSSFYTGPDTIVVTIGEQLAEWSNREFKFATGEVNFKALEEKPSFSFEFKCSPSCLRRSIISLSDQIGILIIVAGLCKFLFFGLDLF